MLFRQDIPCALLLALLKAGNNIAARIAMMAMTTNNSIKVNPPCHPIDRPRAALPISYLVCFIVSLKGVVPAASAADR